MIRWLILLLACASGCGGKFQDHLERPPNREEAQVEEEPSFPVSPRTWRVGVISDMNRSYGSTSYDPALVKAVGELKRQGVTVVLSTGDMVAGQRSGLNYQAMWESFHDHVTHPFAESFIPLLPSPGNHDASAGGAFLQERKLYIENWNLYAVDRFNAYVHEHDRVKFLSGVTQNYPLNYALTLGPALLIALDATSVGPLINNQIAWLEQVLQQGKSFPLKVVFGHVPLYPFAFGRVHETLAAGTASSGYHLHLENLLEGYEVTYFLSGHHHAYFPGRRRGNVQYISVPHLGAGGRTLLTSDRSQRSSSPQGFLLMEFNQEGRATFKAIKSPSLVEIQQTELPLEISVPSRESTDCRTCGNFPSVFFIDSLRRTLFYRLSP